MWCAVTLDLTAFDQCLLNPLFELLRRERSRQSVDFFALKKHDECRNAADRKAACGCLGLLGVYFGKAGIKGQLRGHVLKDGGHHLAGATPGRPEVHHHRKIIPCNKAIKTGVRQISNLTTEQGRFTAAALARLLPLIFRNPVDCAAVWT